MLKKFSQLLVLFVLLFNLRTEFVQAEPAKIGVLAPLTGEMGVFGNKALEGLQLALDQNSKEKISYIVEDVGSGATAEVAKATTKLVSVDHVDVILGAFFLDQTLVAAPITEQAGVPLISMTLCSSELKRFKRVVCGYPSTEEQLAVFGKLLTHLKVQQLALLIENSSYGADTLRVARPIAKSAGIKIIAEEGVNPDERDFRTVITKMMRKKFDTVFAITADPGQSFTFFRQLKEQGFSGARIGYLDIDPKYLEEFGDSIEGIYLPGFIANQYSESFTKTFFERFHKQPDMYAALAFDIAKIISLGLLSDSSEPDVLTRILKVEVTDPAVPNYRFKADRTVSVPVTVLQVKGKAFVPAELN